MRQALALLAAVSAVAAAPVARAQSIVDPSTEHAFPAARTVDGKTYRAIGVGVRKKFVVKVYAMCLYVDEAAAAKALPQRPPNPETVAQGAFGKLAVLHFVREVDASKIRDAYEDSLEDALKGKLGDDVKRGAQQFVALFDKDMAKGDDMTLATTPDGKITVDQAGVKKSMQAPPRLVTAIWEIWLGPDPISDSLRDSLVAQAGNLPR